MPQAEPSALPGHLCLRLPSTLLPSRFLLPLETPHPCRDLNLLPGLGPLLSIVSLCSPGLSPLFWSPHPSRPKLPSSGSPPPPSKVTFYSLDSSSFLKAPCFPCAPSPLQGPCLTSGLGSLHLGPMFYHLVPFSFWASPAPHPPGPPSLQTLFTFQDEPCALWYHSRNTFKGTLCPPKSCRCRRKGKLSRASWEGSLLFWRRRESI